MKKAFWIVLVVVALAMTGCAASSPSADTGDDTASQTALAVDDALGVKNVMLIGMYRLKDSAHPLSGEQATELATLWEAYKTVTSSTTSSTAETEALTAQMQGVLTSDQIAAINAMGLTNDDLLALYADMGIEMPTPAPGEEASVPGSGSGKDLTEEEKAARRDANGGDATGSSRATLVIDKLIEYLGGVA